MYIYNEYRKGGVTGGARMLKGRLVPTYGGRGAASRFVGVGLACREASRGRDSAAATQIALLLLAWVGK